MTMLLQTPPVLLYLIGNSLPLLLFIRYYCQARRQLEQLELAPVRRIKWYHNHRQALAELNTTGKCLAVAMGLELSWLLAVALTMLISGF